MEVDADSRCRLKQVRASDGKTTGAARNVETCLVCMKSGLPNLLRLRVARMSDHCFVAVIVAHRAIHSAVQQEFQPSLGHRFDMPQT